MTAGSPEAAGGSADDRGIAIRIGSWNELADLARPIRVAVFVDEQQAPLALEFDDSDPVSLHAIAFERRGEAPLGTARLLPDGHIGRVAVLAHGRGRGVGNALMRVLIARARERAIAIVRVNAQVAAMEFYRRLGFEAEGEVFIEAGIEHRAMALRLLTGD